jgi:pentatricopeptide repeat protein
MPRLGRAWLAAARSAASLPSVAGPSTSRAFHASGTQQFLWWKSTPESLAKEVSIAVDRGRPQVLSNPYTKLVDALREIPSDPAKDSPLSRDQLLGCMELLSRSRHPADFRLLRRMFDDAERVFGHRRGILHHYYVMTGLINNGRRDDALNWLKEMRSVHGVYPGLRDYDLLLSAYADADGGKGTEEILKLIVEDGLEPGLHTFNYLTKGYLARRQLKAAMAVLDQMEQRGIGTDVVVLTTLLDGLLACGEIKKATDIRDIMLDMEPARLDTAARNVLIKARGATEGFEAAVREVRKWRLALEEGETEAEMNEMTLVTLVQVESTPLDWENARLLLDYIEEAAGMTAGRLVYSVLLQRALSQKDQASVDRAYVIYEDAKANGVVPDVAMVQSLIHVLATGTWDESIASGYHNIAKVLYQDLVRFSNTHRESAPDIRIYNDLAFSCARSGDTKFSFEILERMKAEGISFDVRTLTHHAIALMRSSKDWAEAFKAYTNLHFLDPTVLDRQAFHVVLSAFINLPPAERRTDTRAPMKYVIQFIVDMRRAGFAPDTVTYTLILKYYSQAQNPDKRAVSQIHDIINIDTQLEPDIRLFNTLMRAYSLAGDSTSALNIWRMLRANPALGLNNVSVDIALDTCGHAGLEKQAFSIWNARRREGFPLVKKNWDTWVECLGRLKKFEEASKVVFEEMGATDDNGIPAADAKTFSILFLKLRLHKGPVPETLLRTKEERPEILKELITFEDNEWLKNAMQYLEKGGT